MSVVRAIYRACAIPDAASPHDRILLKVFYPAAPEDSPEERNSGVIPPDTTAAPYPVVVFMPGINLGPESVSWLAVTLAAQGLAVVTYSAVTEEMPGYISLSPGLDLAALGPEQFGSRPSCTTLAPILSELERLDRDSPLAGLLNLEALVLAGHSAGGTAALLNANPEWFAGVRGVFSYAAHSGASVSLGWPAETVLPLPGHVPALIMGGDRDGVIAASAHRYGRDEGAPTHSIERTFDEGVAEDQADSYLFILRGANHFSFAHPHDGTTGRAFLDWDTGAEPAQLRTRIAALVSDFIALVLQGDKAARGRLDAALTSPDMAVARKRD